MRWGAGDGSLLRNPQTWHSCKSLWMIWEHQSHREAHSLYGNTTLHPAWSCLSVWGSFWCCSENLLPCWKPKYDTNYEFWWIIKRGTRLGQGSLLIKFYISFHIIYFFNISSGNHLEFHTQQLEPLTASGHRCAAEESKEFCSNN